MFTFCGPARRCRQTVSRRDVLRLGTLATAGLVLPQASASAPSRPKSVILIWLRGGASHIDSYDMKPDAPAEIRGEFKPASTNVPGIQICDLMPMQAKIMDRLVIVRGIKSVDIGDHTPHYILTGFPDRGKRPVIGSVVSHQQPRTDGLPPYVSLMYEPPKLYDAEGPTYLGNSHRPFVPKKEGLANLSLVKGVSLEQLDERKSLLRRFDSLSREVEYAGNMNGIDDYTRRAMEMVVSPKVREAFDMNREPLVVRERYGKYAENFLRARRLAEAGVSVVTLKVGDWDTHEHNFRDHREQLPQLDRGFHALVTDLHDRGLDKDVAVVVWGEFGRDPRISRIAGRDHWPDAGAAVIAGGGFKTGQVIGETDRLAARAKGRPYTPSNILASLYGFLGIDVERTLPDHDNRPMYILDDRDPVRELE
jgi:Protein of unknown function (DUF1501)